MADLKYWQQAWNEVVDHAPINAGRDVCPVCQVTKGAHKARMDFINTFGITLVDPSTRTQYKPSEILKVNSWLHRLKT